MNSYILHGLYPGELPIIHSCMDIDQITKWLSEAKQRLNDIRLAYDCRLYSQPEYMEEFEKLIDSTPFDLNKLPLTYYLACDSVSVYNPIKRYSIYSDFDKVETVIESVKTPEEVQKWFMLAKSDFVTNYLLYARGIGMWEDLQNKLAQILYNSPLTEDCKNKLINRRVYVNIFAHTKLKQL
jgi:hypothetical protein